MKENLLLIISLITMSMHIPASSGTGGLEKPCLEYLHQEPKDKNEQAPLLILLHGFGSNEKDLFSLAPYLPSRFRILSARAPIRLGADAHAWYHLDLSSGKTIYKAKEAEKARETISYFIDQMKRKYHSREVYLLGFSQGAIMSYSVAFSHPDEVKGILALSGRMLDETRSSTTKNETLQKLKIFIAHGSNDQVLPVQNGRDAATFCSSLQLHAEYKEYKMGHEISQQELQDLQAWLSR